MRLVMASPLPVKGDFRSRLSTLAGAAVLISAVTLASRVLGFGRWIAQASWVGTGGVAEAYAAANLLPNVLFEVVAGGALASAVIPLLTGAVSQDRQDKVRDSASALMTWTLIVLVPLALVVVVGARPILSVASGLVGTEWEDTAVFFLRAFAAQIPLYGVGIVAGGVLQAHRRFFWPAFAPLVSSLVVMVVYFAFDRLAQGSHTDPLALSTLSLGVLAWGTTAGVAAMALTMVAPMLALGIWPRLRVSFPDGQAARARSLAGAGLGALVAQQVTTVVVMRLATTVGDPTSLNVFQYGQAVYFLPYAVLVVPLATSAFPRLSALAQSGDDVGLRLLVSSTSRLVVVICGVGAAVLVAASWAVEVFFESFTRGGVPGMGALLLSLAPSVLGLAAIYHLSRVLYARDNGRAAVIATASGWALVSLCMIAGVMLLPEARTAAQFLVIVGLSHTLGLTIAAVLLVVAVIRDCGRRALSGVGRSVAASGVGAVVGGIAGRSLSSVLLEPGASTWMAVGVGALGASVALVCVLVSVAVIDRGDVRRLIRGRGRVL